VKTVSNAPKLLKNHLNRPKKVMQPLKVRQSRDRRGYDSRLGAKLVDTLCFPPCLAHQRPERRRQENHSVLLFPIKNIMLPTENGQRVWLHPILTN
jgi:hypothetical protein